MAENNSIFAGCSAHERAQVEAFLLDVGEEARRGRVDPEKYSAAMAEQREPSGKLPRAE